MPRLAAFDDYDDNNAWDVYVRVMREDDLASGDTYLVSAPPETGGTRAAADLASFNPHMRAQTGLFPFDPSTQLGDKVLLRVAFESYATNLDSLVTDTNYARDIYYTELLVTIPEYCAP